MADPLDEYAIALHRYTSKRIKTTADHQAIARVEWTGSLWLADGRPCVPAEAVEAAIVGAAKTRRCGTLVRAAVIVRDTPLLVYAGPNNLNEMYEDKAFTYRCGVRVGTRTTMRTRPRFENWSLTTTLSFLPSMIDRATLLEIVEIAGTITGLGDYRPRFGRFRVEPIE